MSDVDRPQPGEPNAPCRSCGAPLAADQRYCLNCGTRRAEARLPFLEILARQVPGDAAPAPAPAPPRGPAGFIARIGTNAAAVAGVACLLLALGVGVLIGGLGHDSAASAGNTPQVISVGGASAAPAAAAAAAGAAGAAAATPAASTTATTPAKASKKKTSAASSGSTSKATNSTVKNLDKASGTDYSKKSDKLPKTLGTGGKAPPVDKSKPVGGGSDVTDIG